MNRGLLGLLAAVLGVSVYLQVQGDDDDLGAPRGREARPAAATRADAGAPRGVSATRPAPDAAGASGAPVPEVPAWAAEALLQGLPAWQARGRAAEYSVRGQRQADGATAWASARPPAPPIVRAPPPVDVAETPPAPVAPPFPHRWVGRFNDGAVLSGTESTWVVHAGDVIEGQWRVDQIEGQRLSLTYLPLNLTQQVVMR